jgi:hypothetical protein
MQSPAPEADDDAHSRWQAIDLLLRIAVLGVATMLAVLRAAELTGVDADKRTKLRQALAPKLATVIIAAMAIDGLINVALGSSMTVGLLTMVVTFLVLPALIIENGPVLKVLQDAGTYAWSAWASVLGVALLLGFTRLAVLSVLDGMYEREQLPLLAWNLGREPIVSLLNVLSAIVQTVIYISVSERR